MNSNIDTKNTESIKTQELVPLSASRIKVLEGCSWMYHSQYILKIPQKNNTGAMMGSVCHEVLEFLLKPDNKKEYDLIIAKNSIYGSEVVANLVKEQIKFQKLPEESITQIIEMILVGLKNDFYVEGGKLLGIEYAFDIVNESPQYRLKGFIDKLHEKGNEIYIDDYKSSKKKYEGEEVSANMQGLIYSLISTKLFPKLKPMVRFIFLQFPKSPWVKIDFKQNMLLGLEEYLAMIQKKINNFDLTDAKSNFAADKAYGTKTFSGRLICGMGKFKGALKKDGKTLQYHCPYRWDYDYFVLTKDGKDIKSALTKEELVPKDGELVEIRSYAGCPRWTNKLNDLPTYEVKPFKYKDVLDDF